MGKFEEFQDRSVAWANTLFWWYVVPGCVGAALLLKWMGAL